MSRFILLGFAEWEVLYISAFLLLWTESRGHAEATLYLAGNFPKGLDIVFHLSLWYFMQPGRTHAWPHRSS